MHAPVEPVKRTRVPPSYENIMRWVATNPAAGVREGAEFFGVTPSWFSQVINSDLFIARYQEWMAELDNKVLLPTLADKIKGAAALAVDRLTDHLAEPHVNPDRLVKAVDVLTKAVRPVAGPTTQVNIQQNFTLDPRLAAIQDARLKALQAAQGHALPLQQSPQPAMETMRLGIVVAEGGVEESVEIQVASPDTSIWDDLSDGIDLPDGRRTA